MSKRFMYSVFIRKEILLHSKKKGEVLPFAKAWMELENIMLSEGSQQKANI